MMNEYTIIEGERCYICRTKEDVVYDEDGDFICTDCLFERSCEEMFGRGNDEDY